MTQLLSSQGIDIFKKIFNRSLLEVMEKINSMKKKSEISTFPPSKNLEVTTNDKFIFAKIPLISGV